MLNKLIFRNYKAFAEKQCVELKPITILIGRNSSGKSVISRLPFGMRKSLAPESSLLLELEAHGIDFGGSFVDLIHGRSGHGKFSLGMECKTEKGNEGFEVTLQHFDEHKKLLVEECQFFSPVFGNRCWRWTGEDTNELGKSFHNSLIDKKELLTFKGLFPDVEELRGLKERLYECLTPALYLGPFRHHPQRSYRYEGGLPDDVGKDGGRATQLLAYAQVEGLDSTVAGVRDFFKNELGAGLEVEAGDNFKIILNYAGSKINWTDAGTGIAQVFPLVVQRFAPVGSSPKLEVVEQPELHLHPAAHAALADLYVSSVANSNKQFIVETHSEVFLLRIRRRIAEGRLSPSDLQILWIDDNASQKITPIQIDENGDVNCWPDGVFSEDFAEVKAMRRARK